MATIAHSNLTDPDIHEPKGVSSAASGAVYVANGLGSGTWTFPIRRFSITLTPSAVSANSTSEQTFTCAGLVASTDTIVGVSKPTHQSGLGIVGMRCPADNQVAITFMNNSGGSITPTAAEVYTVHAHRA